jgi:hypothetical protein
MNGCHNLSPFFSGLDPLGGFWIEEINDYYIFHWEDIQNEEGYKLDILMNGREINKVVVEENCDYLNLGMLEEGFYEVHIIAFNKSGDNTIPANFSFEVQ